jgi:hypothetical protein
VVVVVVVAVIIIILVQVAVVVEVGGWRLEVVAAVVYLHIQNDDKFRAREPEQLQ